MQKMTNQNRQVLMISLLNFIQSIFSVYRYLYARVIDFISASRFGSQWSYSAALKPFECYGDYYNRVISAMEGKLKKEELLKVIGQMEAIEKLPKPLLEELCRVFKVEEPNAPHAHLVQQFKCKVVDIFMQEADAYMDYLQLPKFRTLAADSADKMHTLFSSIWREYGGHMGRQQALMTKKQIEEITPSFDSSQKMEHFHLALLQIYRDSAICPKNAPPQNKMLPDPKPATPPQEINNFLYPAPPLNAALINNGQLPNHLFNMFPFAQSPSYPKVEAHEGNPYIMDNKMANSALPMYELPRFNMQHAQATFYPPADLYQHLRSPQQKMEEAGIVKNLFSEPLQASTSAFLHYDFIQCVCEGRKGQQDKNSFQCVLCRYAYHLTCMKIENHPSGGSVCPLCILRRQTIFCKVTHEPLKFNWHLSERGKQLKVEMTESQSQLIYQARKNGLECQIRFLKINGRSGKKDKRMLDFTSCNGYLLKTTRHTEITLPQLSENRQQPISLEIVLRSDEQSAEQNVPKLYLFAIFLITNKKVDDIVSELFASQNSVSIDYYQEFMKEDKVQVNLQSDMFGKSQIRYPVRGQQCKHSEVFDLKNFLEVVKDLKRDNNTEINCPVCSVACTYFKYDKTIYTAIQNFPDYEEKKPQGISIQRGGEYFWIGDDGNHAQSQQMQAEPQLMQDQYRHYDADI